MSETVPPSRTVDLAMLVELEASWENLRPDRAGATNRQASLHELLNRQKAYELFRAKQLAFNEMHKPAYVCDSLRLTPARLAAWLRSMRDLFRQVAHHPQVPCPVHLLKKAYWCADGLAEKTAKSRFSRSTPPETVSAAVAELQALAEWCDDGA